MEKQLKDGTLIGPKSSLGRYSSLPNRHFLKPKARPDVKKFANLGSGSSPSCHETSECHDAVVPELEKSEKEHTGDQNDSLYLDVVHDDSYPDLKLSTQRCGTLKNSKDDKDSKRNSEMSETEESTARTNSPHWQHSHHPLEASGKNSSGIRDSLCQTEVDQFKNAYCDVHAHADAVVDERKHGIKDVFDRSAVDEFVMKTIPSFGKYASLPPKRLYQPKPFRSLTGSSKSSENEDLRQMTPGDYHLTNSKFSGTVVSCDQQPFSDYIDQLNLGESLGLKSLSCFDVSRPFEPDPASLTFKSFDDTIREFATDSAYQTGDSLKLHTLSLSREELQSKIEHFNMNPDGVKIEMETASDVYHGCIRVLIDVLRPVDIQTTSRRPSIIDLRQTEVNSDTMSFILPRSYLTTIRISSKTTADQVIRDVLNKYCIISNSGRFALFEKINRKSNEGHLTETSSTVYLRKLSSKERPLEICLHSANENAETFEERHFLLRENDKGEILWEAFSLPELNMFIDILLREEESCIEAVRKRYSSLRNALEQRLDQERRENYEFLTRLQSPRGSSSFS